MTPPEAQAMPSLSREQIKNIVYPSTEYAWYVADAILAAGCVVVDGQELAAQLKAADELAGDIEAVKNQIKLMAFTSAGHDHEVMKMCAVWAGMLEKALAAYASVRNIADKSGDGKDAS